MSRLGSTSDGLQKDRPDIHRRRLLFRCWHRGTQEIDLLLGSSAETCLARFDSTSTPDFWNLFI
jgi:antitoxin CptB